MGSGRAPSLVEEPKGGMRVPPATPGVGRVGSGFGVSSGGFELAVGWVVLGSGGATAVFGFPPSRRGQETSVRASAEARSKGVVRMRERLKPNFPSRARHE